VKPVVYIETTIPSYYFDERSSIWFEIKRTQEWWDEERGDYELITSEVVLAELDVPENPYRDQCLELLADISCVAMNAEVVSIAETYQARNLMPGPGSLDGLHLAVASFYRADFLLTWNCRHLANPNKLASIRRMNTALGIFVPILTTPYDLRRLPQEETYDAET
jgi:hypothetical protein